MAPKAYHSVSRASSDWTCQRKRYLSYDFMGTGLQSDSRSMPLYLGTLLHDGVAGIIQGLNIEAVASAAMQQVAEDLSSDGKNHHLILEQSHLVGGLLHGFAKRVKPYLEDEYPEVVAVEKEMIYEHDGIGLIVKADFIGRRPNGRLAVVDYKSTSSAKPQWIDSWQYSPQLHVYGYAVEQVLNEPVDDLVVVGLNKGWHGRGKQFSPFCYGYKTTASPPFTDESWFYERMRGAKHTPVWEKKSFDMADWVDRMPDDVLSNQFPITPPIRPEAGLAEAFLRQRAKRELTILEAKKGDEIPLDSLFPQNLNACSPSWGSPCEFLDVCHGLGGDRAIEAFKHRVPNVKVERDLLVEQGVLVEQDGEFVPALVEEDR